MAIVLGDTSISGITNLSGPDTSSAFTFTSGVANVDTLYIVLVGITNTGGSGVCNSATTVASNGLSFSSDRVTVPVSGTYLITFMTICDFASSGRRDAGIRVNGSRIVNTLSQDNGSGYDYRGANIHINLSANDYISWDNDDWYAPTSSTTTWKTASIALIG